MPPSNYLLVRQVAGVLFLLDLLFYLPYAEVCLGGGYWGSAQRRKIYVTLPLWTAGALSLVLGVYPLAGAATLWLLFRHYYIANRWKNPFRGGGAPGFMSHWTTLYLFLFELAAWVDSSGRVTASVRTMANVDLGVILLCSGSYKALSGYLRGEGMEYGLANPFWGYMFKWFKERRPNHFLFRAQNAWAPTCQILTGICLLGGAIPGYSIQELRWAGAALCFVSFGYLLPTVRLGRLAVLMMLGAVWFAPELHTALPQPLARTFSSPAAPEIVIVLLRGMTVAFIVVLPFVKAMQYLNLFAKIELPGPLQRGLTWYANKLPIIMWRVFTPDVTNFFVRIYAVDRETEERRPILHEDTTYSYRELLRRFRWSIRFLHVTESIALTTVFTTLKYFRSQRQLFEDRLLQYASTLGEGDAVLAFVYVAIMKGDDRFEYVPVSEFTVDLRTRVITEKRLVPDYDYAAPAPFSHIKETIGYGSYAPKTTS